MTEETWNLIKADVQSRAGQEMDALVKEAVDAGVRATPVLAIAFGVSLVAWPNATLSIVVLLFSAYAILDGAWTIGAGARASTRVFDAWPVLLEGAASIGLGLVALAWPFVPRQFVYVLAAWGLITGVLELVAAIRLPRGGAGHWLLGTAGVSSLFLAALVLLLSHAANDFIMRAMAAYALVFGTMLLLAAIFFPREVLSGERTARPHVASL